jgi:dipeptidyl aminopeptidase/acylaminoacyl peptidase
MHGTADETVDVSHAHRLEEALRAANVPVVVRYYEGGDHSLAPVATRHVATTELADDLLRTLETDGNTDFDRETVVTVPCTSRSLIVDWSRAPNDLSLVTWTKS